MTATKKADPAKAADPTLAERVALIEKALLTADPVTIARMVRDGK